jgi:hypothetical protein
MDGSVQRVFRVTSDSGIAVMKREVEEHAMNRERETEEIMDHLRTKLEEARATVAESEKDGRLTADQAASARREIAAAEWRASQFSQLAGDPNVNKFVREFDLPRAWSGSTRSTAEAYLTQRRFRIARLDKTGLVAKRGDGFGIFTFPLNVARLRSELSVQVDSGTHAKAQLTVNTKDRCIEEWNSAFLRIELIELQSVLQGGDTLSHFWSEYTARRKKAAIQRALTLNLAGRRFPPDLCETLAKLESTAFFGSAA